MTVNELISSLNGAKGVISIIVMASLVLIEITPIKINPLSWVGSLFFGKTMKKIDDLQTSVKEIKDDMEEKDIINKRIRVLNFADEMQHFDASKERFEQIITDIDDYEKYCREHKNFANNVALMSIDAIKKEYKRRFLS